MDIRNQVVSLSLAKRMKELGFEQESLWIHMPWKGSWEINLRVGIVERYQADSIPAYTVAELGDMLPYKGRFGYLSGRNSQGEYYCTDDNDMSHIFHADTEANARASMLIHLKEQELI